METPIIKRENIRGKYYFVARLSKDPKKFKGKIISRRRAIKGYNKSQAINDYKNTLSLNPLKISRYRVQDSIATTSDSTRYIPKNKRYKYEIHAIWKKKSFYASSSMRYERDALNVRLSKEEAYDFLYRQLGAAASQEKGSNGDPDVGKALDFTIAREGYVYYTKITH